MGFHTLHPPTPKPAPAMPATDEAEIKHRVTAELARLRATAEAEARARGEAQAETAMEPKRTALDSALAALTDATSQLAAPLAGREADLAALVTELAFLLAKHVIGAEVKTNPEGPRTLVTRLIEEANAARGPRQNLVLRLNPADHETLRDLHPEAGVEFTPDTTITRGGAIAELATPGGDPLNRLEWDATLEHRLAALREAL